ncbi:MAG: FecR domain-containing protein, partial [Planctomycetes bacterium]|nr:FecR domain-containing protein [Planctomycetota bacterium]
ACALLAWGWLLPLVQGARSEGIATVAVADAAARIQRGDQRLDIVNGQALQGGDTVSVPPGSWARVRYADGTMLDIAPASEVTLTQPEKLGKRVHIASGSLTADIAKQAPERRMVFTTPTAAATVLGTRITLEVTPMATRLEVERGRVGLTRRDEPTGIEVGAGEYATIPYGSKGELVAKSIVSAPSVLVERGHGLKGEYFGNLDLTPPTMFTRVDSSLSFDLGFDTPWQDDMRPSRFSVRWTGTIEPRFSERYSFYTRSDSGLRLFIDDHAIIDDWGHCAVCEKTGAIALQAGHRYALRLEYNQPRSGMLLKLSWTSPSQECEVIPAARLTPAP